MEWAVWSLPLIAHEFGHVVFGRFIRRKATANQRAKILGYGFYFDGTTNSATPVQSGRIMLGFVVSAQAAVDVRGYVMFEE